jgi:hypothetical protein
LTAGADSAPVSQGPPRVPRGIRNLALIVGVLAGLLAPLGLYAVLVTCACVAPSPRPLPESPVVGVVVGIHQVSLTQVTSFEIRTSDGKTYTLMLGPLDNATQFSLSHLATHMATGVPIRAFYRLETGEAVVYHLEDAAPATASPAAT